MTKCAVVDCESASRSKGFCDKHYYRFKTHGDPLVTVRGGKTCSVDGCSKQATGRMMCQMHYRRWRLYGDVGCAESTRRKFGEGCFRADGYHIVSDNNRSTLVHRIIVEKAIGKKLPSGSVIHHVDGNPSNNENTNLVVCPNDAYHVLLHTREKALNECGNANWRRCGYCRKYDDPANLRFYGRGERKTPIHKECNSIGHRIYMANRRATANPSLQETLL